MSDGVKQEIAEGQEIYELRPGVSRVEIGSRKFILHEMTIQRVSDFAVEVVEAFEEVQQSAAQKGEKIDGLPVTDLIRRYGEAVFAQLARLWNFVFEFRNDSYEPVSAGWVRENLSIRQLGAVAREVARQSEVDWLIPLLKDGYLTLARRFLGALGGAGTTRSSRRTQGTRSRE